MITFPGGNRRAFLAAFAAALLTVAAAPRPTPSPTPELTGGFGKAPVSGRARREGEKKRVRITNDSLVTDPGKGKLTTSRIQPSPTPRTKEETGKRPASASTRAQTEPAAGEPAEGGAEFWRGEARRLRERVSAIKETIARLEAETKKLETDFYSWDDGAYRDRVIKPAWDKAREDLATARKDLPVAEKELEDLPDRARRAGALPGWLRE
jgi:hypothetical protein